MGSFNNYTKKLKNFINYTNLPLHNSWKILLNRMTKLALTTHEYLIQTYGFH